MPNEIQQVLTKKIGPLPGWVVAIAVGGAVYFLFIRGKVGAASSGAASGSAADQSSGFVSGYQQGYSQGATGPGSVTQAQQAATTQASPLTSWLATKPAGQFWVPRGQDFGTWSRNLLNQYQQEHGGSYPSNIDWPALQSRYQEEAARPHTGGVGGASGRANSIGNRSLDPHAYFHPAMKMKIRYTHFVRTAPGVGGAGHDALVHQTAHTAGIHPARLKVLNPHPHSGLLRIA